MFENDYRFANGRVERNEDGFVRITFMALEISLLSVSIMGVF